MAPTSWITDEMRAAIGRELSRSVSYPIDASDIRRWAIAVYHPEPPPPRFWDDETPGGIVAPEELNPFAWMSAAPRGRVSGTGDGGVGYEAQLGLAPLTTTSMLNGGIEVTYGEPMRPGDVITSVTSLTDYSEREGRLGLMLFTRSTARWTNQHDELVKSSVMTLIRY